MCPVLRNKVTDDNQIDPFSKIRDYVWERKYAQLTNFMDLSPSWEVVSRSATQEIPIILYPKVHYRVQKSPLPVPVLIQIDTISNTYSISLRSILKLFIYLRLRLPSNLFPPNFPTNILYTFLFVPFCYMPCQSHPPWLHISYCSWRRIQVIKFFITQFPQPPVTSSHFGPNIHLSTLFSNMLNLWSSFNVRDQFSHGYRTTDKTIFLCILVFMVLDSRREDIRFWSER
jgi:hypothetical protein